MVDADKLQINALMWTAEVSPQHIYVYIRDGLCLVMLPASVLSVLPCIQNSPSAVLMQRLASHARVSVEHLKVTLVFYTVNFDMQQH